MRKCVLTIAGSDSGQGRVSRQIVMKSMACAGGLLPDGYNSYYRSEYNGCKSADARFKNNRGSNRCRDERFSSNGGENGDAGSAEIIKLVAAKLKQYGIKK